MHFFSHGSTMMLGEESSSADYWKKCGDEALAHGIKGIVMMVRNTHLISPRSRLQVPQGAHWDVAGDGVEVSANPSPEKSPVGYVHPSKYINYKLEPDLPTSQRCLEVLKAGGFNASESEFIKSSWAEGI